MQAMLPSMRRFWKSGENCSAKATEFEDFYNVNDVDSAKIEVARDDEIMAEHFDVAQESAVEDNEKDCESTAMNMEINIPSKVEALAGKKSIDDDKSGITSSSVDREKTYKLIAVENRSN